MFQSPVRSRAVSSVENKVLGTRKWSTPLRSPLVRHQDSMCDILGVNGRRTFSSHLGHELLNCNGQFPDYPDGSYGQTAKTHLWGCTRGPAQSSISTASTLSDVGNTPARKYSLKFLLQEMRRSSSLSLSPSTSNVLRGCMYQRENTTGDVHVNNSCIPHLARTTETPNDIDGLSTNTQITAVLTRFNEQFQPPKNNLDTTTKMAVPPLPPPTLPPATMLSLSLAEKQKTKQQWNTQQHEGQWQERLQQTNGDHDDVNDYEYYDNNDNENKPLPTMTEYTKTGMTVPIDCPKPVRDHVYNSLPDEVYGMDHEESTANSSASLQAVASASTIKFAGSNTNGSTNQDCRRERSTFGVIIPPPSVAGGSQKLLESSFKDSSIEADEDVWDMVQPASHSTSDESIGEGGTADPQSQQQAKLLPRTHAAFSSLNIGPNVPGYERPIVPFGSPDYFAFLRSLPPAEFTYLARSVARYRRNSRLDVTPSTIVSINLCGCETPHPSPVSLSSFQNKFWSHVPPTTAPPPGAFDASLSVMLVELHADLNVAEFLERRLPAIVRQQVGNRLDRHFVVQIFGVSFMRGHLVDKWFIGDLPECTPSDIERLCAHPLYQHMLSDIAARVNVPVFRNLNLCPIKFSPNRPWPTTSATVHGPVASSTTRCLQHHFCDSVSVSESAITKTLLSTATRYSAYETS